MLQRLKSLLKKKDSNAEPDAVGGGKLEATRAQQPPASAPAGPKRVPANAKVKAAAAPLPVLGANKKGSSAANTSRKVPPAAPAAAAAVKGASKPAAGAGGVAVGTFSESYLLAKKDCCDGANKNSTDLGSVPEEKRQHQQQQHQQQWSIIRDVRLRGSARHSEALFRGAQYQQPKPKALTSSSTAASSPTPVFAPMRGELLLPTGTRLAGEWSARGHLVKGAVSLAPASTLSTMLEFEGMWVPTLTAELSMNDGIGVRLAAGCARDPTYRVFTCGAYGVYRQGYTRLAVGFRLAPRVGAVPRVKGLCADAMAPSDVTLTMGVMNTEKNVIAEGCIVANSSGGGSRGPSSLSSSPTVVITAGRYRMDGGIVNLLEGVHWVSSSGTLVEGQYSRRRDIGNASQTIVATSRGGGGEGAGSSAGCRRAIGRWRAGEGGSTHLDVGLRLFCYRPSSAEYLANPRNYVYFVECGRFGLSGAKRHRSGRRWYQKNSSSSSSEREAVRSNSSSSSVGWFSEGLYNPLTNESTDCITVSNVAEGRVPLWARKVGGQAVPYTYRNSSTTATSASAGGAADCAAAATAHCDIMHTLRMARIPTAAMRRVSGFRTFACAAMARQPSLCPHHFLTEEEAYALERAWYAGEQCCALPASDTIGTNAAGGVGTAGGAGARRRGGGTVYFGDHIDEGQWLFHRDDDAEGSSPCEVADDDDHTDNGAGANDAGNNGTKRDGPPAPPPTADAAKYPAMRQFTSIVWEERLVESLLSVGENSSPAAAEGVVDPPSSSVSPSCASFVPMPRYEWLVHEIDLATRVTWCGLPCDGVVTDACSAAAVADPRIADADDGGGDGPTVGDAVAASSSPPAAVRVPPRLTPSDQSLLDEAARTPLTAPLCAANASVLTSVGYVHMYGPVRIVVGASSRSSSPSLPSPSTPAPSPPSLAECAALFASWGMGAHDATTEDVLGHALVRRARRLVEEGCAKYLLKKGRKKASPPSPSMLPATTMPPADDAKTDTGEGFGRDDAGGVVDLSIADRVIAAAATLGGGGGGCADEADGSAPVSPLPPSPNPAETSPPPTVGQHVVKQFLTLKEAMFASTTKEGLLLCLEGTTTTANTSTDKGGDTDNGRSDASADEPLALSVAVHVPLSPDADGAATASSAYRHSWGFVLEYVHWVALRHGCTVLTAVMEEEHNHHATQSSSPLSRPPSRGVPKYDEGVGGRGAAELLASLRCVKMGGSGGGGDGEVEVARFKSHVRAILSSFTREVRLAAEAILVPHTHFKGRGGGRGSGEPCVAGTTTAPPPEVIVTSPPSAKAAPWPFGILCRFVGRGVGGGGDANVTAAACEVAMWVAARANAQVRPPIRWLLSSKFAQPTRFKAEDENGPSVRFFLVDPSSFEYCDVHNCLYNMQFPSVWSIVRLERVQNERLHTRYVEKRRQIGRECRLGAQQQQRHQQQQSTTAAPSSSSSPPSSPPAASADGGGPRHSHGSVGGCNEHRWLAHGTRGVDPMLIAQHGFDHRYSEQGLFGRASYFAYDPTYSHSYRHETGVAGEGQMFLASVVGGNVERRGVIDKEIRHPRPGCHSIDGPLTSKFRGLMVYDLDQAYPSYLVTYRCTSK